MKEKRPHAEALKDATDLMALFPPGTFARYIIAGSIRRKKPMVSDIDIVVIPAFGDIPSGDMFGTPERGNLFWARLEELLAAGEVTKHIYIDCNEHPSFRWGEKLRGINYRRFKVEFWTSTANGWGSQLAIRTGPAEFSKSAVIELRKRGYCNQDGHVWILNDRGEPATVWAVPGERDFFAACGMPWIEPEARKE